MEVRVEPGDPDGTDIVAGRLWSLGAVGIEERSDRLLAAFLDEAGARAAARYYRGQDPVEVDDTAGLDAWRRHASAVRAGPFVLHPPWLDPPPGGRALVIDPGATFGSGSHPSTRLALRAVAAVAGPDRRVLDIGCGSGVLGIGAAMQGAAVVATDIEPEARRITASNSRANGVADRVAVRIPGEILGPFDVVVANLTIDLQEALAVDAARWGGPDAVFIASGLLTGPQVDRLIVVHDRTMLDELVDGEWSCVTLGPRR